MKKLGAILAVFILTIFSSSAQDFKTGIRFTPLNSEYFMADVMDYDGDMFDHITIENRFDSLTIGVFCEKYISSKSFLLRVDFSYADMKIVEKDDEIQTYNSNTQIFEYSQIEEQKFYNVNLGIGNLISVNKLFFTFGIYFPVTILPKGSITRDVSEYYNSVLEQKTTCTGTYDNTFGFGIGSFAGVSTNLLNHISIGMDFTYQIQYLSRKLDWHGETWYYDGTPYMTYADEKLKFRNFFTSRVIPSIKIAYTFNCKKSSKPLTE